MLKKMQEGKESPMQTVCTDIENQLDKRGENQLKQESENQSIFRWHILVVLWSLDVFVQYSVIHNAVRLPR